VYRFTREMVAFRKRHKVLRTQEFYTPRDILWFNPAGRPPKWGDAGRTLGCVIHPQPSPEASQSQALCVLFNAESFEVRFKVPLPPGGERWHVAVDTAKLSPYDIRESGQEEPPTRPDAFRLQPRSMVILIAK
jgi:glycogen operon protein